MTAVSFSPPRSVRLVDALARRFGRSDEPKGDGPTRRSFLARAAVVATALATGPVRYLLRPGTAYAQTTGCGGGNGCGSGWTVFCVTVSGNRGKNVCPGGTFAGGWWKADNSSFCKGAARYYIDCNRLPSQPGACSCVSCYGQADSCDRRRYCCNTFRYGQCHQEVGGVTPVVCRVITCTPPWIWDPTCTTTSRTDNATGSHTAPELAPIGASDITIKYQDLGLLGARVGAPTTTEYDTPLVGRRRDFANGSVVWSSATGAHDMKAEVRDAWLGTYGGPEGVLGFPSSDWVPAGGGARNEFAAFGGTVAWTAATGAHLVYGGIRLKWRELGGVTGPLGYPVGEEEDADNGGRRSRFVGGTVLYRSDVGVHAAWGLIHLRWSELGGLADLSYPLTDEVGTGDTRGRVNWFQNGAIFWTPTTGAHDVRNPVLTFWFRNGGPTGGFGYPTGNHTPLAGDLGGAEQRFERVTVVNRSDLGSRVVRGAINVKYVETGGATGGLGVPTTDEQAVGDGRGQTSRFAQGAIYWTATTGAHEVRLPLLQGWLDRGGPQGSYGYPLTDTEQDLIGKQTVRFERGNLTYDPVTGQVS